MKKVLYFASIIAMAVLTSCNKMSAPTNIKVEPGQLEVVGGKVSAEITGTFPVKKFAKKGVMTITPVIKYVDGQEVKEALGAPVTYVGEKAKENGKRIQYKQSGRYSQSVSIPYVEQMANCELYLRFDAKVGTKTIRIPDMKIAEGAMATSTLVKPEDNSIALAEDKFQRIIQETQEADIKFLIQQSGLRSSELNGADMKALRAAIKEAYKNENKAINKIEVAGYASPDGASDLNGKLAGQRQKNAQNYLKNQMRNDRVKAEIEQNITAEDWAGFQALMEQSNIQDKDLVLRVLAMTTDPEAREEQIKNLSSIYQAIATDILPELRRSRLILTTDLIGKSDEEIMALVANDPAQLNIEEILYAATLTADAAQKMAIYKKAFELYNDFRAINNMGKLYFEQGNKAEAVRCFQKANSLNPNSPDVHYNLALIAMMEGDLTTAEEHLGKSVGTSASFNTLFGTLCTMKGDYKKAADAYGEAATNNAATQHILNEDYAAARKALAAVANPNGTTAYLYAIVGARTNDRDAVFSNLAVAFQRDATLKNRVKTDIEFAKYANDAEFQAIIK